MLHRARLTMILTLLALSVVSAEPDTSFFRAVHMGGNWGRNTFSVQNPPEDYFNYLDKIHANWVGISVAIHVEDSMDSTVEREYSGVGIPTFADEDLIHVIRAFKQHDINVYLTLAFEIREAELASHPVARWQLGDPKMHMEDPNIDLEYWPWAPEHPDHTHFIDTFFKTYTDQAVYFADICEREGVDMYSLGTETNRLFRTRTGGYWSNNFRDELRSMVDSVREAYSGILTYDMEYGALTDAGFFAMDSLWRDMDLDAIGISAYFPLADTMPDTVMSVEQLFRSWNSIFNDHLVPLRQNNPGKPIYFLEFGYVDAVGSPHMPSIREFENKFMEDADQNGLDDGEETQANIHEAFFQVNANYSTLVNGAFLWGNQMASDIDWANSFGQLRDFAIRGKLAENIVRNTYASYIRIPGIPDSLLVTLDIHDELFNADLSFGWLPQASDGMDAGLDILAPPLPPEGSFDARFYHREDELTHDIRSYPLDSTITWDLSYSVSTGNEPINIEWDMSILPEQGTFILQDTLGGSSVNINMKQHNRYRSEGSGPGYLQIIYDLNGTTTSRIKTVEAFDLKQNYPNPFNPITVIHYQLSTDSHVELAVYDISGKKIRTLVDNYQSAGYHRVNWDASAYPSGIYVYRLKAGIFSDTRKMILIK